MLRLRVRGSFRAGLNGVMGGEEWLHAAYDSNNRNNDTENTSHDVLALLFEPIHKSPPKSGTNSKLFNCSGCCFEWIQFGKFPILESVASSSV